MGTDAARAAPRIGRPTKYYPDLARRAEFLCRRGLTDVELANLFGVVKSTLNLWKLRHPEFSDSLKRGKDYADALIVEALYRGDVPHPVGTGGGVMHLTRPS